MSNNCFVNHDWTNYHQIYLFHFDKKRFSCENCNSKQRHILNDYFDFDHFHVKMSFQFDVNLQFQHFNVDFQFDGNISDFHCHTHIETFHFIWQINQFVFFQNENHVMTFCSSNADKMNAFQDYTIFFVNFL